MKSLTANDQKKLAGEAATKYVKSGMVVGLGTGSTVYYAILKLGKLKLDIVGIPTSRSTEALAKKAGIRLGRLAEHPHVDVTIDGADEIDHSLNLIKGMGGALLREKVVASASKKLIIVADRSKVVKVLGTKSPLPVEVAQYALPYCLAELKKLCREARVRRSGRLAYVTDNGNNIIDCTFDKITEPAGLEARLNLTPGVVENGLFLNLATLAIVGGTKGLSELKPGFK
jgi:ribose 5-phosphate isomerase A